MHSVVRRSQYALYSLSHRMASETHHILYPLNIARHVGSVVYSMCMTKDLCSINGCSRFRQYSDGLCSACHVKAYYLKYPEKKRTSRQKYKAAHHEEIKAGQRAYYNRTKDDPAYQAKRRAAGRARPSDSRFKEHIKGRYGITLDEYNRILETQNGVCAICRNASPGVRIKRFSVDHDHATGEIRGLLCIKCNTAIGQLEDNIERMHKAARYLRGELS